MWRRLLSIGAMIAVIAVTLVSAGPAKAQDGNLVPRLYDFCRVSGYPYVYWGNNPACGWGNGQMISLDMNAVCVWSFGYPYGLAIMTNPDPYSWRCFPGISPYVAPKDPHAQETVNGGIHVAIWCAMTGQGGGVSAPPDPWQWKCANGNPVNFGQACIDAWGSARPDAMPPAVTTDIYGWRCVGAPPGFPAVQPVFPPQPQVCQSNLGLVKGIRVWVIHDEGNRVRAKASVNAALRAIAPYGSALVIVNGPVCSGAYVWWYVIYPHDSVRTVGWTAEASPSGNVWLIPFQP